MIFLMRFAEVDEMVGEYGACPLGGRLRRWLGLWRRRRLTQDLNGLGRLLLFPWLGRRFGIARRSLALLNSGQSAFEGVEAGQDLGESVNGPSPQVSVY